MKPGDIVDLRDGRRLTVISDRRTVNDTPCVVLCPKGAPLSESFAVPCEQAAECIDLGVWKLHDAEKGAPPAPVKFGPPDWCRSPMKCEAKRDREGRVTTCPCL